MSGVYTAAILIVIGLLIYKFQHQAIEAFKRFDARNSARIAEEQQDRQDRLAHYKHTARLAEEQVEDVSEIQAIDERLGTPVTRYLFEGETFHTRDEAEAARQRVIIDKAREFYSELPAALASRGNGKLR